MEFDEEEKHEADRKLAARVEGAKAAFDKKTIASNEYPEDHELHWLWLDGWVNARMDMKKKQHV